MESHTQQTIFHLNSDQIKLPSNAYPLQKRMVAQIFSAISQRKSLILESPTGTGKTLCLLSSTLEAVKQKGIQRIFYLTKTHTQMNGIINEIKNTSYQPQFVVAQSKKALCVHKPAIEQGAQMNIQQFNGLCYLAQSNGTKARSIVQKCPLSTKVQADKVNFPPFNEIRSQKDIKTYAQGIGLCPERYQNALSTKAQLIIMPYIYMINGFIFSHKNFNLQNSVFLFDQAHNILQMAEQQSSVLISQRTIQQSKKQISTLKILVQNQMYSNPRGQDIVAKFQTLQGLEKYLFQLSNLKEQLKKEFDKGGQTQLFIKLSQIKQKIKTTMKGFIMFRSMNRQYLQQLTSDLKNMQESRKKIFYINALVNICFKLDEILNKTDIKYINDYICVLYKQGKYGQQKFKVKFHCMTSKPVFDRLNRFKSTFIFASGTLNVSDFKYTGLSFINNFAPKYPQQNPYPNNNVQTYVVSRFSGKDLQIDWKNPNYDMVANYIKSVIPSIKNGILIFFKSYSYLTQFKKYLQNTYFDFDKPVFFEDRVMSDFQQQITKYKQAALLEKGAIMFACMRGKASEGCNFENQYARAVFIIGMPFSNYNSIETKIHQYIKDFQTWYNSGALLAVNQAIGRVVRHQNDFGLIFLLGKKLCQFVSRLSQWIQYNRIEQNLDIIQTNIKIKKFFSSKLNQQYRPQFENLNDNYQDILNEQMLQMWDGESDQQIQTYSKSYSSNFNFYNNQQKSKSSFLSNPVFSFDYPKPKPNFVKKQYPVKTQQTRSKQSLNRVIQPQSDDEQQRILLQVLQRSKRQM